MSHPVIFSPFSQLDSLPIQRRALPIRKGHYKRRYMFRYGGRADHFRRMKYDDNFECHRQKILRAWLASKLPPHTFISGYEYDIKLSDNIELDDSDVALFKTNKPVPGWINLDPRLVFWSQQLSRVWIEPEVREKYLVEKYGTQTYEKRIQKAAEHDMKQNLQPNNYAIEQFMKYPHYPATASFGFERVHIAKAIQNLMCMPDQSSWRLGLFVHVPGHTFSIVVQMGKRSPPFTEDPPTCFIERIFILDTIIPDKFDVPMEYVKQDIAIAITLNSVLPIPQNLFDLVDRVWRPRVESGLILLQEHEKEGFCQHWNTYFLYQVLVKDEDPGAMYDRLVSMSPEARQELIVDFANEAASEALEIPQILQTKQTLTTLPVQLPDNSVL